MMNKVILTGRLTKDPEAMTTSGVTHSMFTIAVQRNFKNSAGNYDADFLPVIAWRQTAEFCNKYLTKGRMVAVEGQIRTRSYTAQDGSKRYVTEIVADRVEGIGGREDNRPAEAPAALATPAEDFDEVEDDDLPF